MAAALGYGFDPGVVDSRYHFLGGPPGCEKGACRPRAHAVVEGCAMVAAPGPELAAGVVGSRLDADQLFHVTHQGVGG